MKNKKQGKKGKKLTKEQQIKREAKIKTFITFTASLLTSLLLPLLLSLMILGYNRNPLDIMMTFLTNGTIITIVISHIITYVTNFFDIIYIFYDYRLWKLSENHKVEALETRFFFGAFGLLFMSMISLISFWSFPSTLTINWRICLSFLFAFIILLLDIFFNYKLTLKKEKEKTEKYEMLDYLNDLEESQEQMQNNKNVTEFSRGEKKWNI